MTRAPTNSVRLQGGPLAALCEPPRLSFLPGLQGPNGETMAALMVGHPRRPVSVRVFPNITAALAALRELEGGAA